METKTDLEVLSETVFGISELYALRPETEAAGRSLKNERLVWLESPHLHEKMVVEAYFRIFEDSLRYDSSEKKVWKGRASGVSRLFGWIGQMEPAQLGQAYHQRGAPLVRLERQKSLLEDAKVIGAKNFCESDQFLEYMLNALRNQVLFLAQNRVSLFNEAILRDRENEIRRELAGR